AVNAGGGAYITGSTISPDLPTTSDALQTQCSCISTGFVTGLNAAGTALVYSTYFGGGNGDYGSSIVIDSAGKLYVTGRTDSTNFPTTAGVVQPRCGGGPFTNCSAAFVSKFGDVTSTPSATPTNTTTPTTTFTPTLTATGTPTSTATATPTNI